MKKDVLEIRYETLFKIVQDRYNGVTPISIKQQLINEIDFKFQTDAKNNSEYLEKKTAYINKEVSETIKLLSHKPKIDNKQEAFDPCEDEATEQEIEDYENYPHTLLIGIPEILNSGKKGSKNSAYRLNFNIKFSIEDDYELLLATRHLYNLYRVDPEMDVNSPMVSFLSRERETIYIDDIESKKLTLLTDTFVQYNTHKAIISDKPYSLKLLLLLISLKASLNIIIKNQKSTYTINNVTIDQLVFTTNSFNIVCDDISIKIESMDQIKLIESSSNQRLSENFKTSTEILGNYPSLVKEFIEIEVGGLIQTHNIFFQNI